MTNYYVRPDGLDAHAGTGPAAANAWLTIDKALGASGIASGDTVYVAPGTYRETVTVAMTSATVETLVIGDVSASQFSDLQGGDVIWTAYTTNDKTAPAASAPLTLSTRDYLTFRDIIFVGGDVSPTCLSIAAGSTNLTFTRCTFIPGGRNRRVCDFTATVDVANNITFDSCMVFNGDSTHISITLPTSASADYDAEIVLKNSVFHGGFIVISVGSSGANSFKGGGVKVYNCTFLGSDSTSTGVLITTSANVATSAGNQCEFYNSLVFASGTALRATTSGQIVEDYNYIIAPTPRTNVSTGSNSQTADTSLPYALLVHLGQERLYGQYGRPFFSPMLQSPLLGFGNDGSVGVQTEDAFGSPRPAGPARTWANASKAIGYSERPNTGQRESTTIRTGSYALKLLGPSTQDVEIPVAAVVTTVSVYARYDSAYGAGTLPRMQVMTNDEIGVSSAVAQMTAAVNTWEQLSIDIDPAPTRAGIVTVRMMSDADGDGAAYFDDFAVT